MLTAPLPFLRAGFNQRETFQKVRALFLFVLKGVAGQSTAREVSRGAGILSEKTRSYFRNVDGAGDLNCRGGCSRAVRALSTLLETGVLAAGSEDACEPRARRSGRGHRFEYPPATLARKKIPRSEEKETLQVLHAQQVEQEKLHPQNAECKNLQNSDEKLKWEAQKTSGSDEQRSQDTTRQNESTCEIRRSGRKIQKSPQKRKGGKPDLLVHPLGKRKRVSFGGHLSPELFDKRLPPNSPLKKGAIPARFSLPFGNSPRAVLKKASEYEECVIKDFSEKDQENTLSRKGSPAISPTARRSLATFSYNLPLVRGRFSVSRVDGTSLSSVEQKITAREIDVNKEVKTPETSHRESQTVQSVRRGKRNSLHRKSDTMDVIRAKRQSGASEANLIVSRSWAEVVKQGVPKSEKRTATKCGFKRRPAKKMPTKSPKNNVPSLKTPTRKVKGNFSTGHANSPAPIVVGKAHTSIVKITAQVPKVMFNYTLKHQQDVNESFTGMAEMFHTPVNMKQEGSLSSLRAPEEASEMHTPEESGEMTVPPLNLSVQQIYDNQGVESPILREVSQISTVSQHEFMISRGENSLDKIVGENSSLATDDTVLMEEVIQDTKEKSDCIEAHSGAKKLVKTPKQDSRTTENPKHEPEPAEELAGVKSLFRTPKTKPEPVEALSGVRRVLRTPKQKPEPDEIDYTGVKELFGPVDGYLIKLSESVNKPHEISNNKFGCKEDDLDREESWQETGLEDSLEKISPNAVPRRPDDGHVELQDDLGQSLCNSLNDVKGAHTESIATVMSVPEKYRSGDIDFQNGTVFELIEEPSARQGAPVDIDAEILKPLASIEKPRKGKAGKSTFAEEHDTKSPRQTRNSSRTKSANVMQPNEKFDQNIPETNQPKESESNPLALEAETAERLIEQSTETKGNIDFDNIRHTQEALGLSRETSIETQLSVNRRRMVVATLNWQAEESLHVEGNVADQERANQFISKTSPRFRNQKNKDELKSEFTKASPKEITQSSNLETSKRNSENQLLKKNTRRRKASSIETEMEVVDGGKLIMSKMCKLETSGTKSPLRTPKQVQELVKALSEVKSSLSPKPEPVKALSGFKRLLRTPKQKPEPVEALSGVKRLLRTPKQKTERIEVLSGVKRLFKTPRQKPEPVDVLSGVKRLLRTPNHKAEPVEDNIFSKRLNSPEGLFNLNNVTKEQKEKIGLLENMEGIQRLLQTPKQKFMPVDDYLGLQKFMAEPKQDSLSDEIDYTGVKELFGPIDGYLIKLSESVNKPHEISNNKFGCKEDDLDREESWQETGLEDSLEKISPNAVPRRPDDGHVELQDDLGQSLCNSLNDVKGAHTESIATVMSVPEKYQSGDIDFQNGTVFELIEEPSARQGAPVDIDAEILKPLASIEKPRKGKAGKSTFAEEHDTKSPRQTRNSSRTKSANVMQPNEKFDQNIPETNQPKESESNPLALEAETAERLIEQSTETKGNIDFDNIRHTQEALGISRETSIETQLSVNRRRMVVATLNWQAEESLHVEGNVADQERANQFISKTSPRFRNQKYKDEPKSEFTKTSPKENTQSSNLETSKRNSENQLLKKNTSRKASSVETEMEVVDGGKLIMSKMCKLDTLENHPVEIKEGTIRRRKKIHFLLEKGTSKTLEEKCVFGERNGSPEEQLSAFSKDNTSPIKENISQKNPKLAAPAVPPSLCFSFSSENQALGEISKDRENFTLANKDLANFAQGEINCDKNLNETQIVPCGNMQISVEHTALKRQKVAVMKKTPPRRGRSRASSLEIPTVSGSKVTLKTEKQSSIENVIYSKEYQSKRSRGRKVAPAFQTLAILTVPKEDTLPGSSDFAEENYLQGTQNEKNFNEVQNVCLDNPQAIVEYVLPKRNLQNDRSKQGISHEPATKNNTGNCDAENRNMVVENAFTVKENHPKRGKRFATQTQENLNVSKEGSLSGRLSFAEEKCLQHTQAEANSDDTDMVDLDNIESSVEHPLPKKEKVARGNLPRRGRSKRGASDEQPTEKDKKDTADVVNQDMAAENVHTVKESPPKRGRGRKVATVTQAWQNFTISKENNPTGSISFAQEKGLQHTHAEENSDDIHMVDLDNIESSVEQHLPKKEKVASGNLPRRGRSKRGASDEQPTEKDKKDTPDVVNQDTAAENALSVKENPPKRGRGRKVTAVTQAWQNFTISKGNNPTGSISFAQEKGLQHTHAEENSDDIHMVDLDNIESSVEHPLPKKEKVTRGNLPRRGRSKRGASDEQPTEKDKKETPDVVNQDMAAENALTVKENPPKRGRGRKVATVTQAWQNFTISKENNPTGSISFAQEKGLQHTHAEENSDDIHMVDLDNIESSVEQHLPKKEKVARGNLPRRGRSKRGASDEQPTEKDKKGTPDVVNQDMAAENALTVKENPPKRGRGRKVATVTQAWQNFTISKENNPTGSISFTQEKGLQHTHAEENSDDIHMVDLDNIESSVEQHLPKKEKVARGNLPRRGRSKRGASDEQPTEKDKKDTPDVVNQDMVAENALTVKENPPKRGRGRKVAAVIQAWQNFTISKENNPTGSISFAQEKGLQHTHAEENSDDIHMVDLDNIESSVEHLLPKKEKVARGNLPRRGRSKRGDSDEQPTEKDKKDTPDVVNQDMAAENASPVRKNLPKRERGRKGATAVPQIPESDNTLISKEKSGVEEQSGALEMAATANKNPSHRGRSKKTPTSSVPASKKRKVVENVNQEEMATVLKDMTKENVSRRGRRKLPVSEASTESKIHQRATGSKTTCIKGKKVSADSAFENQSKSSQRAIQTPLSPALKISITLPSPSDKNEFARKNQNLLIENNNVAGIENLAINGRSKIVPHFTSVRRKCKVPDEDDGQEELIIARTISGTEDASRGRRRQIFKRNNLPKHSDQKKNDQKSDLEMAPSQENENPSKRGKRKQVSFESEVNSTVSGIKKCFSSENMTSVPEAETTGSMLQRGRRKKMKEEQISAITESSVETQAKMKLNRTRRQVL
ncbi:proliferation marker protein Ki-67 isoform X2 [Paroedura picta]|uniref:proliferation marker protein Ki-67 isoform X2 n=1 Tax=Paroedura picta TaxID=143630 RepID=UPI004057B943